MSSLQEDVQAARRQCEEAIAESSGRLEAEEARLMAEVDALRKRCIALELVPGTSSDPASTRARSTQLAAEARRLLDRLDPRLDLPPCFVCGDRGSSGPEALGSYVTLMAQLRQTIIAAVEERKRSAGNELRRECDERIASLEASAERRVEASQKMGFCDEAVLEVLDSAALTLPGP